MGFRAGEALSFFVEYTAWNAPRQLIGACLIYLFRPLASPRPPREHTPHTYSHRTPDRTPAAHRRTWSGRLVVAPPTHLQHTWRSR